jgi:hypothetical protein
VAALSGGGRGLPLSSYSAGAWRHEPHAVSRRSPSEVVSPITMWRARQLPILPLLRSTLEAGARAAYVRALSRRRFQTFT